jgi:predicted metalloprotease with PDZ domain
MLRLLVAMLLMLSSFLVGLPATDGSSTLVEAAPRPMHVIVSFAGLMIFSTAGSAYEVGILVDRNHKFEVTLDGKPATPAGISPGDTWTLSVDSTRDAQPTEVG